MKSEKLKGEVRTSGEAISRMPYVVQSAVCQCLRDGGTWREVAVICDCAGYAGVRPQNVTNYRKKHYSDWVKRQEHLLLQREKYAAKQELYAAYRDNGGPVEAGLASVMETITETLGDTDPEKLKELLEEQPQKYVSVVRTLLDLRKALAEDKRENREAAAVVAAGERKAGFTPEEMARIEEAIEAI